GLAFLVAAPAQPGERAFRLVHHRRSRLRLDRLRRFCGGCLAESGTQGCDTPRCRAEAVLADIAQESRFDRSRKPLAIDAGDRLGEVISRRESLGTGRGQLEERAPAREHAQPCGDGGAILQMHSGNLISNGNVGLTATSARCELAHCGGVYIRTFVTFSSSWIARSKSAFSRFASTTWQACAAVVRSRPNSSPASVRFKPHETCARYMATWRAMATLA